MDSDGCGGALALPSSRPAAFRRARRATAAAKSRRLTNIHRRAQRFLLRGAVLGASQTA
jgi:hypothetical protein